MAEAEWLSCWDDAAAAALAAGLEVELTGLAPARRAMGRRAALALKMELIVGLWTCAEKLGKEKGRKEN